MQSGVLVYKKKEVKENDIYSLNLGGTIAYFGSDISEFKGLDKSCMEQVYNHKDIEKYTISTDCALGQSSLEWSYNVNGILRCLGIMGKGNHAYKAYSVLDIPCIVCIKGWLINMCLESSIELRNNTKVGIKEIWRTVELIDGDCGVHSIDFGVNNVIFVLDKRREQFGYGGKLYMVFINNTEKEWEDAGLSRNNACNAARDLIEKYLHLVGRGDCEILVKG